MILLHHPEVELSRNLLAALPENCAALDWSATDPANWSGPAPSAFPSVLVDVPAYAEAQPLYGPDGEFLGMERVIVTGGTESLRMPASWQAVDSYVAFVEDRARLNPVA